MVLSPALAGLFIRDGSTDRPGDGISPASRIDHRSVGTPPPPRRLDVATDWLLSTTFAVLLALAHVITASKTAMTAKDFAGGDFTMRVLILPGACADGLPRTL